LLFAGCSTFFQGESEYEQVKRKEGAFAEEISKVGGSATKEGKAMHGLTAAGWLIDLSKAQITNELLDQIIAAAQTDPVLQLKLAGSTITDEQLAKLDQGNVLQKTVVLDLSNTGITDAGLDKLSNHYIVSELKLKGSRVTSAAAKRLGDRQIANPQTPRPFKKQPRVEI
jgi:hypothetical protein